MSSGTAALHLIVRALGWKAGDEVVTTPFSFVASANCLLYEGVRPVFVDIDPRTRCLDPALVEAAITPRTVGILSVDVFGHPADWPALEAIAARHHLALVTDSCESLGSGRHDGATRVAAGKSGAAGAFAFYPNKQITTGEGGAVVTDDERIARLCRSMRNQGRDEGAGWLQHARLGYNYRLSELNAALGVSQARRLTTSDPGAPKWRAATPSCSPRSPASSPRRRRSGPSTSAGSSTWCSSPTGSTPRSATPSSAVCVPPASAAPTTSRRSICSPTCGKRSAAGPATSR